MRGRKPVLKPFGELPETPAVDPGLVPDTPEHLSERAKKAWGQIAPILVARNIYAEDTEHMLEVFCVQYARFMEIDEKIREEGLTKPLMSMSNTTMSMLMRLASELGLTPVSRHRVQKRQAIIGGRGGGFLSGQKKKQLSQQSAEH